MRSYSELLRLPTFLERFEYLQLNGQVGLATFGHERWLNQKFYASREWKTVRDVVIARDLGCDLGIEGHEIVTVAQVHHINPMRIREVRDVEAAIFDPENLISCSKHTHHAIHYGFEPPKPLGFEERKPGDTKLW